MSGIAVVVTVLGTVVLCVSTVIILFVYMLQKHAVVTDTLTELLRDNHIETVNALLSKSVGEKVCADADLKEKELELQKQQDQWELAIQELREQANQPETLIVGTEDGRKIDLASGKWDFIE